MGPLLLAALGETVGELTGMISIAMEGLMLIGALGSYVIAYYTHDLWLAFFGAGAVTVVFGWLLALMYLKVKANIGVVGLVFNIFAVGMTSYAYRAIFGQKANPRPIDTFKTVHIPLLSHIPFVGRIFFKQTLLLYGVLALAFVVGFFLYRTMTGLRLRAVGERTAAATASGINATRIRYFGVLTSALTSGLAGAYLMLAQIGIFRDGLTQGKGFIALALVIFGRWNPYKVAAAAFLFAAADALQLSLQSAGVNVPPQFLLSLPFVLTILAISGLFGRARAPESLLRFLEF
jgi:ABC-type uncharacterized transport system permease subunit